MDKTPVYFNMVPGKTIDVKGKKTIKVRTTGSEKRHITVVLACAASGEFLPPMIIFKGKTDRTIKKLRIPDGFVVATQSKAWMDEDLMVRWIKEVWFPYITSKGGRESILCLDSFRAHLTDSVVAEFRKYHSHKAVIPGGCTSVFQPLDVSLNKPFKALLRSQYILDKTEEAEQEKEKLPAPTNQHMVDWIEYAWRLMCYSSTCNVKSFFVTGISNTNGTMDEKMFRDDDLREEIEGEIFGSVQLASTAFDSDDLLATDEEFKFSCESDIDG